jgi:predicted transcriptional regulator
MNWEYKIDMIHLYGVPSESIVRRLNDLGSDGWEIISTIAKGGDTTGVLMKRQKTNELENARRLFEVI